MTTDGVLIASLCGRARRHSILGTGTDAAVAELREVSTSPALLGSAAGSFMASHRADSVLHPFARRAADLLLAAGGDLKEAEHEAARVSERLG